MLPQVIGAVVVALLVLITLIRSVRIVPQQRAGVVERLGRYSRTLEAGPHLMIPYLERVRTMVDLREQVVSFPPQSVITKDSLVVNIDTVVYYTVTQARDAVYEIADFIQGIEQLTVTTLRNVIGSMDLERTLTSRDEINAALRGVLDEATGAWGVRVNRVEIRAIDPPATIKDAMEKAMRADRDKRAAILTAEGVKASQILTAEGDQQSAVLRARGQAEATVTTAEGEARAQALRAQGEAQAIETVFEAIHEGDPDPKLLSYQYLQMLPQIARGDANKLWIVPSELTKALEGLGGALGTLAPGAEESSGSAGGSEDSGATEPTGEAAERKRKRRSGAALQQAIETLGAPAVGPAAGATAAAGESSMSVGQAAADAVAGTGGGSGSPTGSSGAAPEPDDERAIGPYANPPEAPAGAGAPSYAPPSDTPTGSSADGAGRQE